MFCFCLIIGFSKWLLGSMFSWLCICYLFKYCIVHIKKNLFCKRLLISFQVSLTNAKLCNILITISLWKNSSCASFVFYLQDTCCIQIGSNCLKYHYHLSFSILIIVSSILSTILVYVLFYIEILFLWLAVFDKLIH